MIAQSLQPVHFCRAGLRGREARSRRPCGCRWAEGLETISGKPAKVQGFHEGGWFLKL